MNRSPTELLLDRLCAELGFCLPPEQYARFVTSPPTSVRAFTDAVFLAEGLDPQLADKHLWRQVRDRVTEHFNNLEHGVTDRPIGATDDRRNGATCDGLKRVLSGALD